MLTYFINSVKKKELFKFLFLNVILYFSRSNKSRNRHINVILRRTFKGRSPLTEGDEDEDHQYLSDEDDEEDDDETEDESVEENEIGNGVDEEEKNGIQNGRHEDDIDVGSKIVQS